MPCLVVSESCDESTSAVAAGSLKQRPEAIGSVDTVGPITSTPQGQRGGGLEEREFQLSTDREMCAHFKSRHVKKRIAKERGGSHLSCDQVTSQGTVNGPILKTTTNGHRVIMAILPHPIDGSTRQLQVKGKWTQQKFRIFSFFLKKKGGGSSRPTRHGVWSTHSSLLAFQSAG